MLVSHRCISNFIYSVVSKMLESANRPQTERLNLLKNTGSKPTDHCTLHDCYSYIRAVSDKIFTFI